MSNYRVIFITLVPSPYQRDLFASMAEMKDLDLEVYYLAATLADCPWPEMPLQSYEHVLPGFRLPVGPIHIDFNWNLPDLSGADFIVLCSFTSWTGQWLMRRTLSGKRWLFWGEKLHVQPTTWRDFIQKSLLSPMVHAAAIVGIGSKAESDYARRFPELPHFCIPYYCDLAPFQAAPRLHRAEEPFTFLFCGQMIRRKGVDLLLRAFDQMIAKGFNGSLLLVGQEADLPDFLASVSPETRSRIRFVGFQAPERLPDFFAQADAFVLPSRYDGWGVVINQALGAGLPIISSDAVGAGVDLVEEGVNGLSFKAGDVAGLEKNMSYLLLNPEKARRWGEASGQKALTMTPKAGAEKWANVFAVLSGQK